MMGRIIAVSISEHKGTRKTGVPSARLVEGHGLEGDAHAGQWHRQVSLLAIESIEQMRRLGADVEPGDFAENITTADIDLTALCVGDQLRVGQSRIEITQKGKECHSRCAIYAQIGDCVMPRAGIFARVLRGGTVRPGDAIEVMERADSSTVTYG